jgi:cbb3-type cytochrome oxidase maturation protein
LFLSDLNFHSSYGKILVLRLERKWLMESDSTTTPRKRRVGLWLRWVGLAVTAAFVWAVLAQPTDAHDNLGGDELAMSYAMFAFAIAIAVTGALTILWAARSGQFRDVEGPKYTMLENAPDLDDLNG